MDTVLQDLRYALRQLMKHPSFTIAAVLTLALGLGVMSTVYSVFNGLVFRPLPVRAPEQLVVFGARSPGMDNATEVTFPDYQAIRDRADLFTDIAAVATQTVSLLGSGHATRAWVDEVTANYFSMLGVSAFLGRTFLPNEDQGTLAHPVLVLSYDFWVRAFAGDSAIVGRTITLNDHPVTVIGILRPGFSGTSSLIATQAFIPVDQTWPGYGASLHDRATSQSFKLIGRLSPGVSLAAARAGLAEVARQLEHDFPVTNRGVSFVIAGERESRPDIAVAGQLGKIAVVFLSLVGLVLVIACANLANLSLARAAARSRELSVRAALGASRWRIARQLLAEHGVLGLAGGAAGLVIAAWVTGLLRAFPLAFDAPIKLAITPDSRVFLFTLILSLAAGLISGAIPALRATGRALGEGLKQGPRTMGGARQRIRGALVIAQFAVSLLVLVAAGLFVRSLRNAARLDIGFRTDHELMLTTDLSLRNYDAAHGREFYRQLVARAALVPGVRSASVAAYIPFGYNNVTHDVYPDAPARPGPDAHAKVYYNAVAPDYFGTLGMPLLAGRDFTARDAATSPPVAIVSDALAERFWPGRSALGERFRLEHDGPQVEIVGVVRGAKFLWLGEAPRPFLFLPFAQAYHAEAFLQVRTAGDPAGLAPTLTTLVHDLDPQLPVYDLRTMDAHLRNGRAFLLVRMGALLAAAFGILALALATVGLYGVVAYTVAQRAREMGLRLALGAQSGDILRLHLSQGLAMSLIGVGVGLGVALAGTGAMSGMLIGVRATDLTTFAAVAVILTAVALVASWLPSRRATRVDPMTALRSE